MELWGLLSWLAVGVVAGLLAKWLLPGPAPAGLPATVLLGLGGALLGGVLASSLGFGGISGFDLRSLVVALLGSVLVLLAFRLLRKAPGNDES